MTSNGNEMINSLRGFSSVNKIPAILITITMLSLAGIPPVAGFFAKYYVFLSAIESGYTWLVLVGVLSSLIGVYYYFRIIIAMFQPADRESTQIQFSSSQNAVLWLTVLLSLILGFMPGFLTGSI